MSSTTTPGMCILPFCTEYRNYRETSVKHKEVEGCQRNVSDDVEGKMCHKLDR